MPSLRFDPTDEELITDFLKPHVLSGQPLTCDAIRAMDIYAKDPWELVGDLEDEAYFITRRSRTTKGSSRPQRTVPSGTWKMERQVDVTDESGAVIGRRALLSFHFGKKRKASGWVMHEFLLGSAADDDKGIAFQETALCRIRAKRGGLQGGATAKRIKNSLEEDEPSCSCSVTTTTTTVSHHHRHPSQFLEVGSSLMHGSEKEMMVLSPQSVLQCSPPSSILVQSPQQEEDHDVDVAPPLASNPNCERGDQEDGGGGYHKVSAIMGGFTDLLLGPDEDSDQQLAIDFSQMTAEQWDMFCNFGACLEGSTPCDLSAAAAAVSVGESTTMDWPDIALGHADRATASELPTILSETTTSTNEGSTELLVDPDFSLWDLDLEEITEVPPLETAEGDRPCEEDQE